jgi:hypothetical protein
MSVAARYLLYDEGKAVLHRRVGACHEDNAIAGSPNREGQYFKSRMHEITLSILETNAADPLSQNMHSCAHSILIVVPQKHKGVGL